MKKKKSPIGFIIFLVVVITGITLLAKHFVIKDFHIVKPDILYTSAQPTGMDYTRLLYKYHIASIVNVRSPAEHRERNWYNEEVTWARSSGVKYIEMPIEKNNYLPDKKTTNKFFEIMEDKINLPVLLHGSGSDKRVAFLTAAWLIKTQGVSVDDASAMAVKIKGSPLTPQEIGFVNKLKD